MGSTFKFTGRLGRRERRELIRSFVMGGVYAALIWTSMIAAVAGAQSLAGQTIPALVASVFPDRVPQYAPKDLASHAAWSSTVVATLPGGEPAIR